MQKEIIINNDLCKPTKCNQECQKKCPVQRTGKNCITIETHAVVSNELCVGCGQCVKVCPFGAMKMVNVPTQIREHLTLSYGQNHFKLYKMVIPTKLNIIGIIGQNGIGKSTIFKLLTGMLKPNYGLDGLNDAIIFKKTSNINLRTYYKLLYASKLVISYKPQEIHIPQSSVEQTVQMLIGKYYNPSDEFHQEVVTKLSIDRLMNKQVQTLSGGELQIVINAMVLMKKADIYIFDEPTNFLDIRQRYALAQMILKLKSSSKYIFVIDHDMAFFDYMSDLVHIVYGVQAGWGMVSLPYSSSKAINQFFDGFLHAENMRFRDHAIGYKRQLLIQYEEIENHGVNIPYDSAQIKYDQYFQLEIQTGNIGQSDHMILILGENGSGKTTFLNHILNHVPYVTSYKEQYVDIKKWISQSGVYPTVRQLIQKKLGTVSSQFITEVYKTMGIHHIEHLKVDQLSGGEIQRLAIVICLGTPAQIYFLDEPSASLDIEYRIQFTSLIKRFVMNHQKVCFLVEHDLMMAIALADERNSKLVLPQKVNETQWTIPPPYAPVEGLNQFLKQMNMTFRTSQRHGRPKVNRLGSTKDMEQKRNGQYIML